MDLISLESAHSSPAQLPRVRFEHEDEDVNEEERQASLRRGSVSKDLRNQIALRGIIGRNAVSQGYATHRIFSRSQSEASIFRPDPSPELQPPADEEALDNPSNTLWKSNYTKLNRAKSTSSVIGGLNDDILRAGWRRNEPGPYWEQARELDGDREAMGKIPEFDEAAGDGFDVEEMDFDAPSNAPFLLASNDLTRLITSEEHDEFVNQPGSMHYPHFKPNCHPASTYKRPLDKTKSMPVGGAFGTRPDQVTFHRQFDPTFMRMDVPF